MSPRKREEIKQRVDKIPEDTKVVSSNSIGNFSHLTGNLTNFPLIVKNPTPKDFYPLLASLAHANQLDLHYRSLSPTKDLISIGSISKDFLDKIAEIYKSSNFGCYLYYQNKYAASKWPFTYKNLDIPNLLGYIPIRPVVILGFFS
jgi:hypothetical protein